MKDISGFWSIVHAEMGGKDLTRTFVNERLDIAANHYKIWSGPNVTDAGKLRFHPDSNALDVNGTDGPNKGKVFACIFKVEADVLTICYNLAEGGQRPAEFSATPENKFILIQYKMKER